MSAVRTYRRAPASLPQPSLRPFADAGVTRKSPRPLTVLLLAQEYMFGLLMHRLVAVPLLGFCVHFGKISAMELSVLLSVDTVGAVAALALHRRDLRRARVGKSL